MDGARLPLQGASLVPEAWDKLLGNYFDRDELVKATRFGWDLSFSEKPNPRDAGANLPSAMAHSADVDKYVQAELAHGALVGPLPEDTPFKVYASPLGSVPKANSTSTRTITDCSQRGAGINSWISAHFHRGKEWAIHLPTTTHIIECIKRIRLRHPGKRILMFKLDLSRYYRFWLVCPGQSPFLGIKWRGKRYADRAWSFGNRGACLGSQRGSEAIGWIYRTQVPPYPHCQNSGVSCACPGPCEHGDNECKPYVDDLICVAAEDQAFYLFNMLLAVIDQLGLKPSTTPGHLVPPSEVCIGLGIEFDLAKNTVSLPMAKLEDTIRFITIWLEWTVATKRKIKSIAGRLLFCSRVIRSGRLHLNHAFDCEKRANHLDGIIVLDRHFKNDLRWWKESLSDWNGISFLEFSPAGEIAVDASTAGIDGRAAIGAFNFMANQFFKSAVPEESQGWCIADLELLAHVVAARVWGNSWAGLQVVGLTDNEATQKLLSSGRSKIDRRLSMARTFSSLQHRHKFEWVSRHIPGVDNILPDACSRWDKKQDVFWSHCGTLKIVPTEHVLCDNDFVWSNL
jgi:hypothetical protein